MREVGLFQLLQKAKASFILIVLYFIPLNRVIARVI